MNGSHYMREGGDYMSAEEVGDRSEEIGEIQGTKAQRHKGTEATRHKVNTRQRGKRNTNTRYKAIQLYAERLMLNANTNTRQGGNRQRGKRNTKTTGYFFRYCS